MTDDQPKTCMHCAKTKPSSEFRLSQRMRDGRENGCKACHNERRRARYAADPTATLATNAAWAQRNKPALAAYFRQWRADHSGYRTAKRRAEIEGLSDSYVRQLLAGERLRHGDIPQSLVEVQRELLRLKRAINEKRV